MVRPRKRKATNTYQCASPSKRRPRECLVPQSTAAETENEVLVPSTPEEDIGLPQISNSESFFEVQTVEEVMVGFPQNLNASPSENSFEVLTMTGEHVVYPQVLNYLNPTLLFEVPSHEADSEFPSVFNGNLESWFETYITATLDYYVSEEAQHATDHIPQNVDTTATHDPATQEEVNSTEIHLQNYVSPLINTEPPSVETVDQFKSRLIQCMQAGREKSFVREFQKSLVRSFYDSQINDPQPVPDEYIDDEVRRIVSNTFRAALQDAMNKRAVDKWLSKFITTLEAIFEMESVVKLVEELHTAVYEPLTARASERELAIELTKLVRQKMEEALPIQLIVDRLVGAIIQEIRATRVVESLQDLRDMIFDELREKPCVLTTVRKMFRTVNTITASLIKWLTEKMTGLADMLT